jgi:hypothetical protein
MVHIVSNLPDICIGVNSIHEEDIEYSTNQLTIPMYHHYFDFVQGQKYEHIVLMKTGKILSNFSSKVIAILLNEKRVGVLPKRTSGKIILEINGNLDEFLKIVRDNSVTFVQSSETSCLSIFYKTMGCECINDNERAIRSINIINQLTDKNLVFFGAVPHEDIDIGQEFDLCAPINEMGEKMKINGKLLSIVSYRERSPQTIYKGHSIIVGIRFEELPPFFRTEDNISYTILPNTYFVIGKQIY